MPIQVSIEKTPAKVFYRSPSTNLLIYIAARKRGAGLLQCTLVSETCTIPVLIFLHTSL